MKNIWRVFWDPRSSDYHENLKAAQNLSNNLGCSEFISKLLVTRGITDVEEAREFLNPSEDQVIDPFKLKDMEKGVKVLSKILEEKEKIVVFGDYDVDGVTSASILFLGLKELGFDVDAYIPSRMDEGYSLNNEAIEDLNRQGFKNIITVDCGITSVEEINYAKKLGMKVVVTDHHEQKEILPPADAVINPKRKDGNYPFKGLAGVGVAFKFLLALTKHLNSNFDPYTLIDLVAIGTIADIVPLLSENRYFVKRGLEKLKTNPTKGIAALLKQLRIVPSEIKSNIIAYKVAPKINAAGRMADAFTAFKLLTSENKEEINKNVSALIRLNSKRQTKEKEIYLFALSLMDVNPEYKKDKVIVLHGENWHLGVLGIVASKLSSQFNKPVLMVSEEGEHGKGSARSLQGISLMNIFKKSSEEEIFDEFGGHELAAGFSLSNRNIKKLRYSINNSYQKIYGETIPINEIVIDMEIEKIWPTFFDEIAQLEPYGYKNPEPIFLMKNVRIDNLKFFGNAVESFAGKMRNNKDFIMDIIGYGLAPKLKDIRYNNPNSVYADIVGNFREENSYSLKHKFLKFYLKDLKLITNESYNKNDDNLDTNNILKEELFKISKMEVIERNLHTEKIAMFLPSKLKYAAIIKKTLDSIKKDKKVIIISSSHLIMNHTYNILSSYISPNNIYYNKKSRLKSNIINKEKIIMLTVPAFFHNAKLFNFDKFEIIVDEPYYSISHNAIKNISEYKEFRKYIVYKKANISVFGTLFHTSLKEFLKRAGFKILVSNVNVSNYEIIKEKKNLMSMLKDYLTESKQKVIVLNEKKKQDILSNLLKEKFGLMNDAIKLFNHSMDFSSKIIIRENMKKHPSNILITSYSNNGLSLENQNKTPIFILLDLPKSRLELIDLFSSWNPKKGPIDIVLGYDEKFKTRLLYDYSRFYPSSNILKQTYDFIKEKNITKENELIDHFFKGDQIFGKIVIDELLDSGLLVKNSNQLDIIENFNLKSLHKTVKYKESIIDSLLIKETIHFYKNVDTKAFMDMLKNDITNIKNEEG